MKKFSLSSNESSPRIVTSTHIEVSPELKVITKLIGVKSWEAVVDQNNHNIKKFMGGMGTIFLMHIYFLQCTSLPSIPVAVLPTELIFASIPSFSRGEVITHTLRIWLLSVSITLYVICSKARVATSEMQSSNKLNYMTYFNDIQVFC